MTKTREAKKPDRIALVTLGTHRSGTSAMARVLNLLGAELPKNLLGENPTNKKGHWEPIHLIGLHDTLLAEARSSWYDWRPLEQTALSNDRWAEYKKSIKQIISDEFGDAPIINLKEPRMCRFLWLYDEILDEIGFNTRFIIPFRNPLSVADSLNKRDKFTRKYGHLIWLRNALEAELATRGRPRFYTAYEDFLDNWRSIVPSLIDDLKLDLPNTFASVESQIDKFIDKSDCHHENSPEAIDDGTPLGGALAKAYEAFQQLAKNPAAKRASSTVDQLRQKLDSGQLETEPTCFDELTNRQRLIQLGELQHDKRIKEALAANDELQKLVDIGQKSLSKTETDLEDRKSELDALNRKIGRLEKKLTAKKAELTEANNRLSKVEIHAANLEHDTDRQSRVLESYKSRFAKSEERRNLLISEKDRYRQQLLQERLIRIDQGAYAKEFANRLLVRESETNSQRVKRHRRALEISTGNFPAGEDFLSHLRGSAGLADYSLSEVRLLLEAFDSDYYLKSYPEVKASGENPFVHFMRLGWKDQRIPSEEFLDFKLTNIDYFDRIELVNFFVLWVLSGKEKNIFVQCTNVNIDNIDLIFDDLNDADKNELSAIIDSFDEGFYLSNYPEVSGSNILPIIHYLAVGWKEGKDPSNEFSTSFYLRSNPDIHRSGINPFFHWVFYGKAEGRPSKPDNRPVLEILRDSEEFEKLTKKNFERIAREFDREFYIAQNRDVDFELIDPMIHFLTRGWKENRDPSAQFSTQHYLDSSPDLNSPGINPFIHWVFFGRSEGRKALPSPGSLVADLDKIAELEDLSVEQISQVEKAFDTEFYLNNNPDIASGSILPFEHYLLHGWKDHRDPSPHFSTKFYLENAPDISEAGINPFIHWVLHGRNEGRLFHPLNLSNIDQLEKMESLSDLSAEQLARLVKRFDVRYYMTENPEVEFENISPIEHFLTIGWKEGRDPSSDFSVRHYLENADDVAKAGINPFVHWTTNGRREVRSVHPDELNTLKRLPGLEALDINQIELLRAEFDANYYLNEYQDIDAKEIDPFEHYMIHGWKEGRDPSPSFSTNDYLKNSRDVAESEINPFIHWVLVGRFENRLSPSDNKSENQIERKVTGLEGLSSKQLTEIKDGFDSTYYLTRNPDVAENHLDPFEHFIGFGWKEGRDPSEEFSITFYSKIFPELQEYEVNPYLHWVLFGKKIGVPGNADSCHLVDAVDENPDASRLIWLSREKRQTVKDAFDASFYRTRYPDARMTESGELEHFLYVGWRQEYDPAPNFSTRLYLYKKPELKKYNINPFLYWLLVEKLEDYVPRSELPPPARKKANLIAFYLPQYHSIPENDDWWGKGFTEWTNVKPAKPQFVGHYQPHVPGDLGYYNLLEPSVFKRQVELAKQYGVHGFCFYFYWFAGKRLLEKPLENWLSDKSLDFPFCVCWANENWSRRWDGRDQELLISQKHSPKDDIAFIAELAPYLSDERYIRIDGKPLLVIYRPSLFPSARATAKRWRKWCRENGIGEIHLAYTQSFESANPAEYGFDSAIEFPPNNIEPKDVTDLVSPLSEEFDGRVLDWHALAKSSKEYSPVDYSLFRSVCPGWDNTARRASKATVFINNSPEEFRRWLERAICQTSISVDEPEDRLIFVNAWNEWAEGAKLEPDQRYGYAFLQATRDAVERPSPERNSNYRKPVLIVSHDAHPHGAQYLALGMTKSLFEIGFDPNVILLAGGSLEAEFREVAKTTKLLSSHSEHSILAKLEELKQSGVELAIANTTVSGSLVPLLKKSGMRVVSLVHELGSVLESFNLRESANALAANSDFVIFPAEKVRRCFEDFLGCKLENSVIRPQGLLRKNPYRGRAKEARKKVAEELGLDPDCKYVLNVAYADHRKGPDLFVEIAREVLTQDPDLHFIWVGHQDQEMMKAVNRRIRKFNLSDRVHFIGFNGEPMHFYAGAKAYALTSREDPFPNVVLESAEVDVPVVAFGPATGATDFILEHGGVVTSSFEVSEFADALTDLVGKKRRKKRRKKSGLAVPSINQYVADILHVGARYPRVSVVVPNYNYENFIEARLNSIINQSAPPYELIVLDDASSDGSEKRIQQTLKNCDIDWTFVRNKKNSGSVFRQWQKGIELAKGDIIWIAEADDLCEEQFLAELLPAFDDPDVVMTFSQSKQIGINGEVLSDHYLDYVDDVDSNKWRNRYKIDGKAEIANAMCIKNTIPNVSGVLFRRDAIHEVLENHGDEIRSYKIAGDWIAYIRLLEKGSVAYDPRPLNLHRRHRSSLTVGNFNIDQLKEIVAIQRDTARKYECDPDALEAAKAYAQNLYEQFGLNTNEYPRYSDHPEII